MTIVKVQGTTFVRDTDTMALINRDVSGLEEYRMKRKMLETQRHEINNVKSEIAGMKNDMAEIKQLMIKLLEGSNG